MCSPFDHEDRSQTWKILLGELPKSRVYVVISELFRCDTSEFLAFGDFWYTRDRFMSEYHHVTTLPLPLPDAVCSLPLASLDRYNCTSSSSASPSRDNEYHVLKTGIQPPNSLSLGHLLYNGRGLRPVSVGFYPFVTIPLSRFGPTVIMLQSSTPPASLHSSSGQKN